DPVRKRFVLFGDRYTVGWNDTWEMYVRGNSCVTADDCHTGFCVDGVCCETACNGTCEACASEFTGGEDGVCAPVLGGCVEPDAGSEEPDAGDDAGDEDAGLDAGDEDAGEDDAGLDAGDDDAGDEDAGLDAGDDDAGD